MILGMGVGRKIKKSHCRELKPHRQTIETLEKAFAPKHCLLQK
jgi:hypothetical protein